MDVAKTIDTLVAAGEYPRAETLVKQVIQQNGATLRLALLLGDLQLRQQRWQAAADVFQQVIREQDGLADGWMGLGLALLGAKDWARAHACFQAVVQREPSHVEGRHRLATCAMKMDRPVDAGNILHSLARECPERMDIQVDYGLLLTQLGRPEEAVACLEPAAEHPLHGAMVRAALASAYITLGHMDDAQRVVALAHSAGDSSAAFAAVSARLDAVLGRPDEARATLEAFILESGSDELEPCWHLYIDLVRQPLSAEMLERLQSSIAHAHARQQKGAEAACLFARAHHHRLAKDTAAEMADLQAANALRAAVQPFDVQRASRLAREVVGAYPKARIETLSAQGDSGFQAVFILSPPRSGSTLLEQLLAGHSALYSAEESNFLGVAWHAVFADYGLNSDPSLHEQLSGEQLAALIKAYREAVRSFGFDDQRCMVHKGINNHRYAGLLAAMFPSARFVQLDRHPADVALGCFRQNFESQFFSFTPEGIAAEIRQFQDNMAWWREQMGGRLSTVSYEALAADPEPALQALLRALGLDWEPGLLALGEGERRISTASANQIRSGVTAENVERWRQYGADLAPLLDALDQAGVSYQR